MVSTSDTQRLIDLSHPVVNGMRVYPGIPAPSLTAFLTHEQSRARYGGKCELVFSEVHIVAGVGTYLDAPYHRDPLLPDFAQVPLDRVANLRGVVLDLRDHVATRRAIDAMDLGAEDWPGHAVLLRTGLERAWDTDRYWEQSPFLTQAAAERLVRTGIALLAVDFLNVDDTSDPRRPVHTDLLRASIPIVENLRNLGALPPSGFRFFAAPAALSGVASFPVRAYALVEHAGTGASIRSESLEPPTS